MKECVIVLGMHRSGTSVLAGLVSILGGFVGADLMSSTEDNPKGYFENNKIYNLNEKILTENKASWDNYSFVVEDLSSEKYQQYVEEAKKIIQEELKYVKRTTIKDPRISILLPIWGQALKELNIEIKLIFVYRSPMEVVLSMQKRDEMGIEKGLMLWSHYFFQAELYSRDYKRLVLEYAADFQDIPALLEKIGGFIGKEVDEKLLLEAKEFYTPALQHHQVALDNISNDVPTYLNELITILIEKKLNSRKRFDRLRNEFNCSKKYYLFDYTQIKEDLEAHQKELAKIIPITNDRHEAILQLESQRTQLSEQYERMNEALKQKIEASRVEIEVLKQDLDISGREPEVLKIKLEASRQELDTSKQELEISRQELEMSRQELEMSRQEIKEIILKFEALEQEKSLEQSQELDLVRIESGNLRHELSVAMAEHNLSGSRFKYAENIFQIILKDSDKYKRMHDSQLMTTSLKKKYLALIGIEKNKKDRTLGDRKIIQQFGLFSPLFYLTENPDVLKSGVDPLKHFCDHGWKEGRRPTVTFDIEAYKEEHYKAIQKHVNPLIYFIEINKENEMSLDENITKVKTAFNNYYKNIRQSLKKENKVALYTYEEPELTNTIIEEISSFKQTPMMSVIIPVYNVEKKWLEKAINSIERQWYDNWEINIADDASTNPETIEFLKSVNNSKIKIKFLTENGNISNASNEALALAIGDYVVLMDHDDELTPDALYEVVKRINETGAEFIYSDEDKLEMDESFSDPHFKPDFSPEMFFSHNYISHLGVIRKTLVDKVGGWSLGLEGAQDYDLYLKVFEHTKKITHIPKVLYHWRKIPGSTAAEFSEKSYAQDAGIRSLERAVKRRNISASVINGKYPGTYRVIYDIIGEPLVSIVIPFKDKPDLLDMCVNSVLEKSTYQNYEIIGVSNNSEDVETLKMMEQLKEKDNRISFYEYDVPFNYSEINNYAVNNYTKGQHIILLNNDIDIITPEWIEAMLQFSQREDVGAVGAKLYYPNDTIQHAGVAIGVLTLAGHSFKHASRNSPCYMGRESVVQNVSAVTAACLMVKKTVYDKVNGLNEIDLKIAFNDIDFCLRVQEEGFLNVYTPYCEAYHHESISRGEEDTPEKRERFITEVKYTQDRHSRILEKGDPFYNINLTLESENYQLRQ